MREPDFERLWAEHSGPLLRFLWYRTGDRALAEDLLGDTFERALRARRSFSRARGSEKTWLYSIALHRLTDVSRRSATEQGALERIGAPLPADAGGVDLAENRQDLQRALDGLSTEERETVALRYGADLRMRDISKLTGVPIKTIEGRLHRAVGKLRDRLD
jgi:RNA polymerase sigma factor (sigma-70 family)